MADFIPVWAASIAQFEGFNDPNNRAARNHNPGNLKYAGQPGATGKDPDNFAVFPDDQTGMQALYNQLAKYVRDFPGYTLLQATARYLGQPVPRVDSEGDAFSYAGYVGSQLGVDPAKTTLAQLAAMVTDVIAPDTGSDGSPLASESGSATGIIVLVLAGGLIFWLFTRSLGW